MKILLRVFIFVATIFFAIILPWWLSALFLALMILIFAFPELLFGGFVLDLLYGSKDNAIFHIPLFFTFSSCVLLLLFIFLRTKMKFY